MNDDYFSPRYSQRKVFLWVSAIISVAIIVAAREVMLPFVLALVVAYVLSPMVSRVERYRIPRWAAILLVYFGTLGSIGGFVAVIVPRLASEGQALANEAPRLSRRVREEWLPAFDARLRPVFDRLASFAETQATEVPQKKPPPIRVTPNPDGSLEVYFAPDLQVRETGEGIFQIQQEPPAKPLSSAKILEQGFDKAQVYLKQNALTLLKVGQEIVGAVSRAVFNLFMTLMLAAYLMLTREKIILFFRELWPPSAREAFDRFLRRLDRGLAGVVRGQLLICLVNGVLSAIGFRLFELKYWPILTILATVLSLIPIFGSILSTIPAVAIGLTQSPMTAIGVLAWILGIHQVEANFLNPKIIGDTAKIHPVLVVFSLLVGEHFFQLPGALFAVPCMSIAQTIFLHFRESTMGLANPLASIQPPAPRAPQRTPLSTAQPPISIVEPPPETTRTGNG